MRERRSTAGRKTRVLYELIVKVDAQRKLKAQEETFARRGEAALQKEYAQIYGIVMRFLDKIVEVLGDEPMSLRDYQKILEAGLAEVQVGLIPPASDLYLSLTKPSEGLYLSYCKADAGGASLLPSYLVGTIRKLFPALAVRNLETEQEETEHLETMAGIRERFLKGLHRELEGRQDRAFGALYRWYKKDAKREKELERLLSAAF